MSFRAVSFLAISFLVGSALGQSIQFQPRPVLSQVSVPTPAAANYDVVAIRVEFQSDTTRFTTGDGTFGGTLFDEGLVPNVDPLPHDETFFNAHLLFLEDYIATVSDGRTVLNTHLIPGVVQLSQTMDAYTPIGQNADSDAELAKLAAMIQEAWQIADASLEFDATILDPATTSFVLFHAGVGRDIELIGTTLEKTPLDVPSLYFGEQALSRLLPGDLPLFKGLRVTSTIVLPRTETRVGNNFITDSKFLAEFSTNGLLAASFLNYLGVPDLFNTEDGTSAIGPFGLMDPLGIFAFNGLFPPEPSAWTKEYLGWIDLVDSVGTTTSLTAVSDPTTSEVARIDISDGEYFLVENRNRDPEEDGLRMQVQTASGMVEQVVTFDDETFTSRTIEGFVGGVVTSVDNYDWALPGGSDGDGANYTGGILIWHIDRGVLARQLASNSVNNNPSRRAVDVEEADGAQDLGFPPVNPFAPPFDLGTPFDFFYEGNPVTVITAAGNEVTLYENRFGSETYPNSNNNLGGPSFIELRGFSPAGMVMSFDQFETPSGTYVPRPDYARNPIDEELEIGGSIIPFGDQNQFLSIQQSSGGAVTVVDEPSGSVLRNFNPSVTTVTDLGSLLMLETEADGVIDAVEMRGVFETYEYAVPLPAGVSSARLIEPLITLPGVRYAVAYSSSGSSGVFVIEDSASTSHEYDLSISEVIGLAANENGLIVFGTTGVDFDGTVINYDLVSPRSRFTAGSDNKGIEVALVDPDSKTLTLFGESGGRQVDIATRIALDSEPTTVSELTLVDLDDDGNLEVLFVIDDQLAAFTRGGALVDGFPVDIESPVITAPLVLKDAQGAVVILASEDGYLRQYVYASPQSGWRMTNGFPLSIGASVSATPLVTDYSIYAVATSGGLFAFDRSTDDLVQVVAGQKWLRTGNPNYVEVSTETSGESTGTFLDPDETYIWPNPVRDASANIRIGATRDCSVTVTIIDRAGRKIDELTIGNIQAGVSTEYVWNTSASSGVYFGRVRALAADGSEDMTIIKIAVIR